MDIPSIYFGMDDDHIIYCGIITKYTLYGYVILILFVNYGTCYIQSIARYLFNLKSNVFLYFRK